MGRQSHYIHAARELVLKKELDGRRFLTFLTGESFNGRTTDSDSVY